MARNFWPTISNINTLKFWLRSNKCIVKFDKIYLYALTKEKVQA